MKTSRPEKVLEATLANLEQLVNYAINDFAALNKFIETHFQSHFFASSVRSYSEKKAGNEQNLLRILLPDVEESTLSSKTSITTVVNHPIKMTIVTTPEQLFNLSDTAILRDLNPSPFFDGLSPRNLMEKPILKLIKFLKSQQDINSKEDYSNWNNFNFLHLEYMALYVTNCAALIAKMIASYYTMLEAKSASLSPAAKLKFQALKDLLRSQAPLIYAQILNISGALKGVVESFKMQMPLREIFFDSASKAIAELLKNLGKANSCVDPNKIDHYREFLIKFDMSLYQCSRILKKLAQDSQNFLVLFENDQHISIDEIRKLNASPKKNSKILLEREFRQSTHSNIMNSLTKSEHRAGWSYSEAPTKADSGDKENIPVPNELSKAKRRVQFLEEQQPDEALSLPQYN